MQSGDFSANLAAVKRRLETFFFGGGGGLGGEVLQVFFSWGCLGGAFEGRCTGFYDAEI